MEKWAWRHVGKVALLLYGKWLEEENRDRQLKGEGETRWCFSMEAGDESRDMEERGVYLDLTLDSLWKER